MLSFAMLPVHNGGHVEGRKDARSQQDETILVDIYLP
jgi:hypothetical protein